jgi:hypothetical protein
MSRKLLVDASWAALAAFVFGLCLAHTLIKHFDGLYGTGVVVSGALLIFVLLWTRRALRALGTAQNEAAKQSARTFLASCVFFSMLAANEGIAVSAVMWVSSDFIRTFGVVFYAGLMCAGVYCVRRDAKRVTDSVSSQMAPD